MAEENTTDSTQTTTAPTDDQSGTASTDTSTTDQETQTQTDDTDGGDKTILTSTDDASTDDQSGDDTSDDTTATAQPNEFFGAPEGDYELTGLPEGTEIDTRALEAVSPVAKEMGLSNEGLSKIAGVYAEKVLPQVVEDLTDRLQRDVAAQHATWANEAAELVKTDPVFEGRPLPEVQKVAAKFIDRFGGEDFRKFLDVTGLGNHPAMIKIAYQGGNAISEDTTFERGNKGPKPKSTVEKFYGS